MRIDFQKHVLGEVFRIGGRARKSIAEPVHSSMVLTDQLGPCAGIPVHAEADDLRPVNLQGSYLPARELASLGATGVTAQRASGAAGGFGGRSRLPRPALFSGIDAAPHRF